MSKNFNPVLGSAMTLAAAALVFASSLVCADDTSVPVPATPYSGDLWTRSTLTGDWWGVRNDLANKGITFNLDVVQVYQGVLAGGLDKGWQYGGRDDLNINLDTQKMGLWPGGFLNIEGESNFGHYVGPRQSGTLLPPNENALFPQTANHEYDLTSVTYMQFVAHQLGFYAGKLATITDDGGDANNFAHGKGAGGFLNTNFGFNPALAITVPYSTLGAGVIILPTSDPKQFIIQAGAVDTQGDPGTSGFDTAFKGGTTFLAEARYTTHFFDLTGHQLIGGDYSDQLYTSLDQNLRNFIIPRLPIQKQSGSYAVWYNFDQYLYQPDPKVDKGIGVFGRVGNTDGVANPLNWFYSGGIGAKGLIPGRGQDSFGVGYFYIQAAKARALDVLGFRDSQGFEAYYEFAITPWMHLTPDIQVVQPSQQRVETATILGVRLTMKF
jgi:porin